MAIRGRNRLGHGAFALVCLAALGASIACSTSSDPGSAPNSAIMSGEYKGALSGASETGTLDIALQGGSLKANALRVLDLQDQATATGTIAFAGSTIQVSGTFDPDTGALAIAGGGYTLTGQAANGGISGGYTGQIGRAHV